VPADPTPGVLARDVAPRRAGFRAGSGVGVLRVGVLRVVAAVVALALVAAACTDDDGPVAPPDGPAPGSDTPTAGGTLRIALPGPVPGAPTEVAPADPAAMLAADLLWDGLTAPDPDGGVRPGLAATWATDDATTWTFQLDPDATFGDGSPVTAADVVASLEAVAAGGEGSLAATRLEVVQGWAEWVAGSAEDLVGLRASDDGTVEIALTTPFAGLPDLLAGPLYGITPAAGAGAPLPVTSSGATVRAGEGSVVRVAPGARTDAWVDAFELHPSGSAEEAWEAFLAGNVDVALVPASVRDLGEDVDLETLLVTHAVSHATVHLGLRAADGPLIDRPLRQAIAAAVDQPRVIESAGLDGRADPLADLIPAGVPGWDEDACPRRCEADLDRARVLLGDYEGSVPTIRLDHEDSPIHRAIAAELAEQLAEAGITLALVEHPPEVYPGVVARGEVAAFLTGWVGLFPRPEAFVTPLLASGSGDNVVALASAELDAALAEAAADLDGPDLDRWSEITDEARDISVIVPLAQLRTRIGHTAAVRDLALRLDGTLDLAQVWLAR
jgi:ABC-type transport system substrate-binding protein